MTTPAMPAESARCSAAELGGLFLFEKLTDDQLAWLCREGSVIATGPGMVYVEGEPAENLYVLLNGTIVLSRRIGGDEVEVSRTSGPGAYAGAFFAYLGDRVPQAYNNSLRATEPARFYVLAAAKFAHMMTDWFPMAAHLLEGLLFGTKNTQEAIGQRERLLALGSLSAGLAHELNNPAAAAVRAAGSLRERVAGMRGKLAAITAAGFDSAFVATMVRLQEDAAERVSKARQLSPIETADAEDEVSDWLDAHGISASWDLAPLFVQAGLDSEWLDQVALAIADHPARPGPGGSSGGAGPGDGAAPGGGGLESAIRWLGYTVETEVLMSEITDSVTRISALVGAARQYSQLDRAPYQVIDVHDLLDSTLVMLDNKVGPDIRVVKDYDRSLPRIPAFPAELNQVWTNLIDNAVSAMDGTGTLTIRTAPDRDKLLVEFADTGPGIPDDIKDRIFEPFFTTKPVGQGTGLGLDISWRIVVTRHHGDLKVQSVPGDTRFRVWLPVTASQAADDPMQDIADDAAKEQGT
ncbi:MAG: ATP-binding protein [Streptosporangiaceae bacterium]